MPETFIIKQHLNYGEFLKLMTYVMVRMKIMKRIFLMTFVAFILITVFSVALYPSSKQHWGAIIFQVITMPFLPVLSLSIFILFFSSLLYLLKPKLVKNITYRFTHWGMEKTGKGIEFTRPWRGFTEFRETKSFFLLFVSPGDPHAIQKRMFKNQEEAEDFKKFVSEHINK